MFRTTSSIQSQLTKTQIDHNQHREHIKSLKEFLKCFPNRANINALFLDPKDGGAKCFPIKNQLIAANNDLNQFVEMNNRPNDHLVQIKMMAKFIVLTSS